MKLFPQVSISRFLYHCFKVAGSSFLTQYPVFFHNGSWAAISTFFTHFPFHIVLKLPILSLLDLLQVFYLADFEVASSLSFNLKVSLILWFCCRFRLFIACLPISSFKMHISNLSLERKISVKGYFWLCNDYKSQISIRALIKIVSIYWCRS